MHRLLPIALVVIGLAVVVVSLMGPAPEGRCLATPRTPGDSVAFAQVERKTALAATVHYRDGLDLDVRLAPQRIVSTLPGITEMLAHLGALDRLVGRSPWCDTPSTVTVLPAVSVQPLSAEELLALEPDLVVLDSRLHRQDLDAVMRHVPHVLLLETSSSLGQLGASFTLLADVLDDERAREAARGWNAHRVELQQAVQILHRSPPPRVLLVGQWEPLFALGPGSLLDDVLATLGAVNVACDLSTDASGVFSDELALARKPDWILGPGDPMPQRLHRLLSMTPAVQEGRVLPVVGVDAFARGGPRILDATALLARRMLGYGERPDDAQGEGEPR